MTDTGQARCDHAPLCACGCGQPAPVARKTSTAHGVRAGQQLRYVHGHGPTNGHGVTTHHRRDLTNQLEQAGHAEALTRALRDCLIGGSLRVGCQDIAGLLGAALGVDPARITVGHLPRNGLQIRVAP